MSVFPEIRFRAARPVPPTVLPGPAMNTPVPLGRARPPAGLVPMKVPVRRSFDPASTTPTPRKRLTTRPLITESSASTWSPTASSPALVPLSWILRTASSPVASVLALAPSCVYPSMITVSVIAGSGVAGVMVFTAAVLWMPKLMVSAPRVSFASSMAARSVHWRPALVETSQTSSARLRSLALPTDVTTNVTSACAGVGRATVAAAAITATSVSKIDRDAERPSSMFPPPW